MADILDLPGARAAIRVQATDTSHDSDLTATYIPATTVIVEDQVGPVMTRTGLTYTRDGGRSTISLPSATTGVTQVTETGTVLVANQDYTVNLASGIVTRGSVQQPYIFLPGQQNIVVTYNVGYAAAPANVKANVVLAARIILAHLWQSDQQGYRPQFGAPDNDVVMTPSGFAIPRRAASLLRPTPNLPGFG